MTIDFTNVFRILAQKTVLNSQFNHCLTDIQRPKAHIIHVCHFKLGCPSWSLLAPATTIPNAGD